MTRMLPATIHSSVESNAERRLFETIRDAPNTERWVCLHSLGIALHERKRRAFADNSTKRAYLTAWSFSFACSEQAD